MSHTNPYSFRKGCRKSARRHLVIPCCDLPVAQLTLDSIDEKDELIVARHVRTDRHPTNHAFPEHAPGHGPSGMDHQVHPNTSAPDRPVQALPANRCVNLSAVPFPDHIFVHLKPSSLAGVRVQRPSIPVILPRGHHTRVVVRIRIGESSAGMPSVGWIQ